MLDDELQLGKLGKILEVLRLDPTTPTIGDGEKEVTEDGVGQVAVALMAVVASSLVNILGSPEGTIGNINIESQASAWSTNRGDRLA